MRRPFLLRTATVLFCFGATNTYAIAQNESALSFSLQSGPIVIDAPIEYEQSEPRAEASGHALPTTTLEEKSLNEPRPSGSGDDVEHETENKIVDLSPVDAGPLASARGSNKTRESLPLGAIQAQDSTAETEQAESDVLSIFTSKLDPRTNELTRVLLALGAVVMLIVLLRLILKRGGAAFGAAGRPSGVIEILARYPVSRGQQLVLIKLCRRVVLVLQQGSGMTTLTEMDDPHEVAHLIAQIEAGSRGKDAARFKNMLNEFEHEHVLAADDQRGRLLHRMGENDSSKGHIVDLTGANGSISNLWRRKKTA